MQLIPNSPRKPTKEADWGAPVSGNEPRVLAAARVLDDGHRLAGKSRLPPNAPRATRTRARPDGGARSRRIDPLRRGERPLRHISLSGQLEEQHLHSLCGTASRGRSTAV